MTTIRSIPASYDSGTSSVTSVPIPLPADLAVGDDVKVIVYTATAPTLTPPAGWTVEQNVPGTSVGDLWLLTKTADAGDTGGGKTCTVTLSASARAAGFSLAFGTGADDATVTTATGGSVAAGGTFSAPASDNPTTPSDFVVVVGAGVSTNSGDTPLLTIPAGYNNAGSAVSHSGLKNATVAAGYKQLTTQAASATAQFSPDKPLVGVSTLTFLIKSAVTNTPPSTNAGTDETVTVGDAVTITATDTAGTGAITSGDWTQVSGPTALALTKSGTNNKTVAFAAPATTGTYVLRRSVTDANNLTASDDISVTVVVAGQVSRPASDVSNAGGWSTSNGTNNLAALLRDGNNATYIESPQGASGAAYKGTLDPIVNPGSDAGWSFQIKASLSPTATSGSVVVRFYNPSNGSTIATRTINVTSKDPTAPDVVSIGLTTTEVDAILDDSNIGYELDGTAA